MSELASLIRWIIENYPITTFIILFGFAYIRSDLINFNK